MTIADDLTDVDVKEATPPDLQGADRTVERARWKYQRYMRDYLRCIHSIDDNVGRILDVLDEQASPTTPSSSTRRTRASSSATTAGSTSG